jgi:hypothetical protein
MPFMSLRLLIACQLGEATIHTALDDLESFLWLLIWCIVHASKGIEGAMAANRGIKLMLDTWKDTNAMSNVAKSYFAESCWKDAVFGGLIQEWLEIFRTANEETWGVLELLPTIPLDNEPGSRWSRACSWLETKFTGTYEDLLKSGFHHLKNVEKYSNWEELVDANLQAAQANRDRFMLSLGV